nr:DUF2381 family protein [Pyxidicoccus xibeiensis]
MEARLSTLSSRSLRSGAVRSEKPVILPGATGSVAIVADRSAFMEEGRLENLALEIFNDEGYRQAVVLLDHRLARE